MSPRALKLFSSKYAGIKSSSQGALLIVIGADFHKFSPILVEILGVLVNCEICEISMSCLILLWKFRHNCETRVKHPRSRLLKDYAGWKLGYPWALLNFVEFVIGAEYLVEFCDASVRAWTLKSPICEIRDLRRFVIMIYKLCLPVVFASYRMTHEISNILVHLLIWSMG